MKDLNRVMLLGNLGADPEIRYSKNGKPVVNLKLATNKHRKVGNDWEKETEWHRVTAWGEAAERVAEGLSKGSRVLVEGEIRTRKWKTSEGETRYTTEVSAFSIGSQERREGDQVNRKGGGGGYVPQNPQQEADFSDDIPF